MLTFMLLMGLTMLSACGGGAGSGNESAAPSATGSAAAGASPSAKPAASEDDPRKDWPESIAYGVLPNEETNGIDRGNQQLADDMSEALGIDVELFVGEDYTAVIEAMRAKEIDLAYFSSFPFILAAERAGAVPMAVRAESEDKAYYNSHIIVPKDSTAKSLKDLKGKAFLFADPASTSGHLFPRAYLIQQLGLTNEELETYFSSLSFSGGHEQTILAIANGDADGGGVSSNALKRMLDGGLVTEDDYRILATSDPIPSSPFSYRGDLPESLVEEIRDFVLNYHATNPEYFSNEGYTQFYPVTEDNYKIIYDTAELLNMSPEQLLAQ